VTTLRRAAEHTAMPWANGRGVSYEVARDNDAAGEWRWRLAIAPITEDGPFSPLPGVHRELTLIDGDGLVLTIDGNMVGCHPGQVIRFAGYAHTHAALTKGPVVDLNVMSREDAPMTMSIAHGPSAIDAFAALVAISACAVMIDDAENMLQARDALVGSSRSVQLVSGTAAVIRPMR
jgi:environmental stress-induced protein Ves